MAKAAVVFLPLVVEEIDEGIFSSHLDQEQVRGNILVDSIFFYVQNEFGRHPRHADVRGMFCFCWGYRRGPSICQNVAVW